MTDSIFKDVKIFQEDVVMPVDEDDDDEDEDEDEEDEVFDDEDAELTEEIGEDI